MNSIVSRAAIAIALMSSASVNAQVTEPSASEAENDLAANDERTIVVTAQRREQSLQDVPIAISAFGAETLQDSGITSLDLLGRLTPGLTVAGGRGGSSIFLRGVGARTTDPGDTASVAVYVDGVYMPSPLAGLFSYPDVERIEVLKGPQGTLFGQSATGGLLHIITRKPSFSPEGEVRISYGNYDTASGRGYISGGLTDTIAASISLNGTYQGDGFGQNLTTGEDVFRRREWSTRGKILWEPTPDTEVVLTGFYGKDRSDYGTTTPPPGAPVALGFVGPANPYDTFANNQEFPTIENYGGSLRIVHDFGGVTLTSTTGYGRLTRESVLDQEQSPAPFVDAYVFESSENWQQEFLLTGSTGRLDWAAGVIHFEDVSGVDPVTIVPPALQGTGRRIQRSNSQTLNSTAVFGQITYAIIDPLRVTLGFRNTWDSRRLRFLDQIVAANSFDPRVSPVQSVLATVREDDGSSPTSQASWSEPTYRIGLDYDVSEGLLLYASFSTGYKTGTFSALNIGPVGQPPSVVDPETLDAFEAGFKWDSSDGLLRVNASAFHYDFKNIQLLRPFVGGAEPFNAASTRMRGIDFDATVFASSALTMTLSAAYLDPRYTSFPDGRRAVPNPDFGLPGPNGATPFNVIIDDLAGERPSDAPTFTASFSADFRQPVSFGPFDEFQANFLYNYNDGFVLTEGTDFIQESYHLMNLRVGLGSQKGWEINAFMNNITDQAVIRAATRSAFGDAAFYAPPRTYGLELGFRW
jgi:iron complex outermembrane receptor protein